MQWGSDWHASMRASHLSQSVVYERTGKFTIPDLSATFSKTTQQVDSGNGVLVAYECWSFIVSKADLVDNGVPFEPRPGDKIIVTRGTRVYTYDLSNMGNQRCWRDHDRFKNSVVIYTDAAEETSV